MPILAAEPDHYPSNLWLEPGPIFGENPDRRWWCLHTKPRQEKVVARVLRSRGIAYYLPQVQHVHRTPGGRTIRSILPLFGGYLFLLGEDRELAHAAKGDHVANFLRVPDHGALHHDLHQVYRMLSSGLPVVREPSVVVGTRIRILIGPLKGLIGTVIRRGDQDHFVAQVRFLGTGATITLKDYEVEAVAD